MPVNDNTNSNKLWGGYTTTDNTVSPWVDDGSSAERFKAELERLNLMQQQQQALSQNQGMYTIAQRLERIESSMETLLNMLKLILGTQLGIEKREKENSTPQDDVS